MSKKMKRQRPPFSLLALIAANLAPLFGVLIILKIGMDIWLHTKSHKAIASEKRKEHRDQNLESGVKEIRKIQI